jgi:hypothetical protein
MNGIYKMNTVMQIDPRDTRYFADINGKSFIPVGCNLCFVRGAENMPEQKAFCCF